MIHTGIDIGSTTAKMVVLDAEGKTLFCAYERHNAKARETLKGFLEQLHERIGNERTTVCITGSVGMGLAEQCGLSFTQEVVAATKAVQKLYSGVRSMIDIGGEDAKVVFFKDGKAEDLRMNGNCAGGTGAFIDQMAILLGIDTKDLNILAEASTTVYPIASRCGVFSKTDVQNLIAKNVSREDIAASVFHAVAVQVVVTLAHGCEIKAPVLMCGGPLTFLPQLRKAFADYLHLSDKDIVLPTDSHLIPAMGAALSGNTEENTMLLSELADLIIRKPQGNTIRTSGLKPIFTSDDDHKAWLHRLEGHSLKLATLPTGGHAEVYIGIDSGSTTTKIVALNAKGEMLYSFYHNNDGDPVGTAWHGLALFQKECQTAGTDVTIVGSCSTGYGEDLLKASLNLDHGIIETIAHYMAARNMVSDASFILDIGGQDMKAIFINNGVINRMEINEACSSGCGSFIETFAKSLGYSVNEFAKEACKARAPYDLGTRCTVFMNSKVKQALREGTSISDIAAGLSFSVIKNCLYKVLRLKDTKELGQHIVVQGGTMRNDSVVRAFELLTGQEVVRSSHPELMGAVGCALYAVKHTGQQVNINNMLASSTYTTNRRQCRGCENHCLVTTYQFAGGNRYYSGNRCERVFTNKGAKATHGINAYNEKLRLLFNRTVELSSPKLRIGIPRCLNMFEEYPFWHSLFTASGLQVVLSAPSTYVKYEAGAKQVMSDNICFPAKLVHSHIADLVGQCVDRIFMPFVVYEKPDGGQNSYNCPIVSGYAEVIKGTFHGDIPIDSPAVTFKDKKMLQAQCEAYLTKIGIDKNTAKKAFEKACRTAEEYQKEITGINKHILKRSREENRLTVLLAGRPYHTDPLVQHKLSEMIAALGADVITEDITRGADINTADTNFVSQWAYANRILKAAEWAAAQDDNVQFMQMTSFGCGPDAFLVDETRSLLKRHGKTLTLLKIDDVSNIGSLRLRVRSVIESMRLVASNKRKATETEPFKRTPIFEKKDQRRKIIAPFFTPFISPLLPSLVRLAGYEMDSLPISDNASCDYGLRYANNEVCYPATLIVGDIVKAFKDKRYDPLETAVIITQTGGQCRATNYISLIKKALTESGFGNVPVLSLASGTGINNEQPGFKVNWLKMMPIVVTTLIYSDSLAKFYYASAVREKESGMALNLLNRYMNAGKEAINRKSIKGLWNLLESAALDFDSITTNVIKPRVGIVGEIYLKFNPFAQRDITEWLISRDIEVVPPLLTDFFLQRFVNMRVNQSEKIDKKVLPNTLLRLIYNKVWKQIARANDIGSRFRHFTPFESIFEKAENASKAITLYAQFGEGWLLPGEIISMAKQGVTHVISLQPFGCIANHIVSKGIEKRIKALCPGLNILNLDFDSGVSDVNIRNRILLFIDNLENKQQHQNIL